jgi:hypothetical protein
MSGAESTANRILDFTFQRASKMVTCAHLDKQKHAFIQILWPALADAD